MKKLQAVKTKKPLSPYTVRVDNKVVWRGDEPKSEKAFADEVKKNYDRDVILMKHRKQLKKHEPENENKRVVENKEDVPDVYEIVEELENARYHLEATAGEDETDVRLQVSDGYWNVHIGDASYDTDHSGSWGASMINTSDDEATLYEVAEDLINEVLDGMESY
jgi:hypothetical protein